MRVIESTKATKERNHQAHRDLLREMLTRRQFVRDAGLAGICLSAMSLLACQQAAPAATPDFTVTSSVDNNHSHKVTISGADVDRPPTEKTLTSDGTNHTHTIKLAKQDYEAIKKGQEITVTSSATGATPHTHTFKIRKP